jgi:hypothetical protein
MVVGRMIYFFLPEKQVYGVKASWLAKFFIWLDVFSFLVQAVGGSMLSNQDGGSVVKTGMRIYQAGIGVQEFFIVLFLILTQRFHVRMSALDRAGQIPRSTKWRLLTWIVYSVLALITVSPSSDWTSQPYQPADSYLQMRIIFRLVEFGQGVSSSNPILTHEGYTFGLDALPMLLATVLLNMVHPGMVLKGPESEFPRLSRKGKKVAKQEKRQGKVQEKNERKEAKQTRKEQKKNAKREISHSENAPLGEHDTVRGPLVDGVTAHHDLEGGQVSSSNSGLHTFRV